MENVDISYKNNFYTNTNNFSLKFGENKKNTISRI
jgi:hypothetical protein